MTKPASFTQADMERIAKGTRNAGWPSVRIKIDLARQTLDVVLSEQTDSAPSTASEWDAELEG